jgi:hypothetical protein
MRQIVRVSVGLCLLAVLVGCAPGRKKSGEVSGKVTYKSNPVNDAALLLHPSGGAGAPLTVPVDAEGNFRILDMPKGTYKVVVEGTAGNAAPFDLKSVPPAKQAEMKAKMDKMKGPTTIPFPNKYKDVKTTDLSITITDQPQTVNLELKD